MKLNIQNKIEILADAAKYDASCASSGSKRSNEDAKIGSTTGMGICHSYAPDGRCISLLKILLTNYCIYDCKYCINRISSNTKRARFTVDEIVNLTLEFYKRNYIEGLFLSSGIIQSSNYTMEQLMLVAKKLRLEHGFGGYIHLKTIPEADQSLIDEAAKYADRLSINVELPTDEDLTELAPEKNLKTITTAMGSLATKKTEMTANKKLFKHAPNFIPGGQSTQMIVGATDSSDKTIINRASKLYDNYKLRRVYYSAFSPIPDSHNILPSLSPPLIREHRLYQADWLLRFYGFKADEILAKDDENLDLEVDPKTSWALKNREFFPVDINKASRQALLRIPGLGTQSVDKILKIRRHHRIKYEDLAKLRVSLKKIKPFIAVSDYHPSKLLDLGNLREHLAIGVKQLNLFTYTELSM
jgi:putative DNA modification/repair radical SAM protein